MDVQPLEDLVCCEDLDRDLGRSLLDRKHQPGGRVFDGNLRSPFVGMFDPERVARGGRPREEDGGEGRGDEVLGGFHDRFLFLGDVLWFRFG